LFDMLTSFCNGNITYEQAAENLQLLDKDFMFKLTSYFLEGLVAESIVLFNEILDRGFDSQLMLSGLAEHFRNLMICKHPDTSRFLEVSEKHRKMYTEQATKTTTAFLLYGLNTCYEFEGNLKTTRNPAFYTELALVKMCHFKEISDLSITLEE